jgi:hypothetical protein
MDPYALFDIHELGHVDCALGISVLKVHMPPGLV